MLPIQKKMKPKKRRKNRKEKKKKKERKKLVRVGLVGRLDTGIICSKTSLMPEGVIHLSFISGKFSLPVLS